MRKNTTPESLYKWYLDHRFPIGHPKGEEFLKLHRKAMAGDKRAEDEIILRNAGLAFSYVFGRYGAKVPDLQDLVQEAFLGIKEAIPSFEPKKGSFASVARVIIKRRTNAWRRDKRREVRISQDASLRLQMLLNLEWELQEKYGRKPINEEIAKAAGIKAWKVHQILGAYRIYLSFDAPVDLDDDDSATVGDTLRREGPLNPLQVSMIRDEVKETARQLRELRGFLEGVFENPRDREIFLHRYGMFDHGEPKSLDRIGKMYGGLTRERVRKIINRFFGRRLLRGLPISTHKEMLGVIRCLREGADLLSAIDGFNPPELEECLGENA